MSSLLNAVRGDKLEALYVLAITTGMRQGELLGLQWKDIDLESGTLRVNRGAYAGAVSPPKTNAERRTIKLSKSAIASLRNHRVKSAKSRYSEWVHSNAKGTTIGRQNLHNRSW